MSPRPEPRKWSRSQKFRLSEKGTRAGERYREMIVASRATLGRGAFDAARDAWARELLLCPGDGAFLGEMLEGALTIDQLAAALDACGTTREETRAAVDRLTLAGLLEALPIPEAPPRWR
ncbi:MAG: hypothetical protein AB1938_21080 [Myxococcota bacterium]